MLGPLIKIPPSNTSDGTGARIGVIKRAIVDEARRRLYYNSTQGDPIYNRKYGLYLNKSLNSANVESLYPSTETFGRD